MNERPPQPHVDVITALLEQGARVKEKNSLGWTPLGDALVRNSYCHRAAKSDLNFSCWLVTRPNPRS